MIDQELSGEGPSTPARREDLPRATAAEKLTGGMRIEDMLGWFPPDAFEGFDEEIRALRRGFRESSS